MEGNRLIVSNTDELGGGGYKRGDKDIEEGREKDKRKVWVVVTCPYTST
jgi:hypothetical protein